MAQGLELKVGADVSDAINGAKLLGNQLERLAKLASMPNLSFQQQERLNALLIKTQSQFDKFGKAAELAGKRAGNLAPGANQASLALTNLGRVAQDAPFGFIGIQNNINPLLESFGRLKQETGSTGLALKALAGSFLGPAGLGVAISLVTSAITFFIQAKQKAKSETKALKEEEDVYVNTLAKERVQLDNLFSIATSANVPLKARTEAVKELRQQYGAYLKDFSDEEILAGKAAVAYQKLAAALINVARAKAAEAAQIENSKKILENEKKIAEVRERSLAAESRTKTLRTASGLPGGGFITVTKEEQLVTIYEQARKETEKIRAENLKIEADQKRLADAILKNQVEPFKVARETVKGIANNVKEVNTELQRTFTDLSKVVQQAAQIKNNLDPTIINPERRTNPINIQNADRTSSIIITPEALKKQGEYLLGQDELLAKLAKQQELINGISTASNSFIDSFFGALANNQDPFAALAQSAKRLVFELGAAVLKALALKAITAAITGGTSAGLGGLSSLFSSSVLRGDQLRTLTFLRG